MDLGVAECHIPFWVIVTLPSVLLSRIIVSLAYFLLQSQIVRVRACVRVCVCWDDAVSCTSFEVTVSLALSLK